MVKKEKNIDFYTTGRQPTEQEFVRISEWIKKDKERQILHRSETLRKRSTPQNKSAASRSNTAVT